VRSIHGSTVAVFAVATVTLLLVSTPTSAHAKSLLDAILGIFGAPPPAMSPIQQVPPDVVSAPPQIIITPRWSSAFSGISGYCVRLCDGRYFPFPHLASNTKQEKFCNAPCPGSRTIVYWGAPVDQARTSNGSRYSDLTTAFDYRKKIVPNCTCNGNDIFGTAAISIRADITLRPGDIVITESGVNVFIGTADSQHNDRDFTLAQNYLSFSAERRRKLSEIQITRRNSPKSNAVEFNTGVILGTTPLLSSNLISAANGTQEK
jgi:hypothetical protein